MNYLVIFALYFVMFDSADGLKYYDFLEGKGSIAEKGSTVQVSYPLQMNNTM